MKAIKYNLMRRALALVTTGLALGGLWAPTARADMYRMTPNAGGGIPAQAVINPLIYTATNCTLSWYGLQGWYTVQATTNILSGLWTPLASVKATDFAWSTTVPNTNGSFFRLSQANSFSGSGNCGSCHGDKYAAWSQTEHAIALSALTAIGMGNNASCIPCHTVGFGQPTGYTNQTLTPHLANVGCENCHGAAGWHKDSDHSVIRPAVSIDPAICGSCHQDSHHPTFEEYSETLHSEVNLDIKYGNAAATQYYTNTAVVNGVTLYGYFITTNANGTLKTNATTGIINSSHVPGSTIDPGNDRSTSCGICHSAATRMAMLNDYQDRLAGGAAKPLSLPAAVDAGAWTAACATCHDPHSGARAAQLRNPMYSTNFYTMPSLSDKRNVYSTNFLGQVTTNVVYMNTTFASLYNPEVNVCGQCHNHRGARWDGLAYGVINTNVVGGPVTNQVRLDIPIYSYTTNVYGSVTYILTNIIGYNTVLTNLVTTPITPFSYVGVTTNVTGYSRPPHHSPQYNILTGLVQENYIPQATHPHTRISTQCAACHAANYAVDANNQVTGHTFEMNVKGCSLAGCHTSYTEAGLHQKIEEVQVTQSNSIARVVSLLNQWATSKAPAILGAAYNTSLQNSWEFTIPGQLAGITNAGPSTANQLKLPEAIRQARFDLYMAANDGSLGVHNPTYVTRLLTHAETNVASQFPLANFLARTVQGVAPLSVAFTNLGAGIATYDWNFGDGGLSASANPTYIYTNPGLYTVTFTANGTETLTRTAYIKVAAKPTVSFTANATTVPVNTPVTFTNDSSNISDVGLWRMQFNTANSATRVDSGFVPTYTYTYTNAGTYTVSLRATAAGVNTTTTKTNYIVVTP